MCCSVCIDITERTALSTSLTGEQLCECSRFGGLSWLLLLGVGLSSVLLPGNEEEEEDEEEELGPDGLLRLLLIPADKRHKTENNLDVIHFPFASFLVSNQLLATSGQLVIHFVCLLFSAEQVVD